MFDLECTCNVYLYRLRENNKKPTAWIDFRLGEYENFKDRAERIVNSFFWNSSLDFVVEVDFKKADSAILETFRCEVEVIRELNIQMEKVEVDDE